MSPAKVHLHTPPQLPYSHARQQGTLLDVKVKLNWSRMMPPEKRGVVNGFTKPARLRMLKAIARIDWNTYGKSVFVTVTYPDAYADRTPAKRTQDRGLLIRAMEHELGGKVSILWRLEYKRRRSGACVGRLIPHFHAIVLGVPYLCQKAVRKAWRTILGHVGPLATDVRTRKSGDSTAQYLAKYAAKEQSVDALDDASYLDKRGRAWGLTRKSLVHWAEVRTSAKLNAKQERAAMEVARHLLGRHYTGSFFVFHHEARTLFHQIENDILRPVDGGKPIE